MKNTRFHLFSILILCSISFSYAQEATLSFQAAPMLSIYSYDTEAMAGPGFTAGVSCNLPIGVHWSIRPELNYQQRIFREKYSSEFDGTTFSGSEKGVYAYRFSYLELPVLFQYRNSGRLGFYIGPQFGLNINVTEIDNYEMEYTNKVTGEVSAESGREKYSGESYELAEVSLAFGPNYTFDFGLAIECRLQRSIILFESGDPDFDQAWTLASLGVRYSLPVGTKSKE